MRDLLKLARIQIVFIALFAFFKLIRPSVLESNAPEWMKLTLLSLPNFFEAVVGILILTCLGAYLNRRVLNEKWQIGRNPLYALVFIIGSIYVITQELKIHNLGGHNVFDENDIVFSIFGLITGILIVISVKPQINTLEETK